MSKIIIFDIDGVIRDVSNSYRRAIADTVEKFTDGQYRPTLGDIDLLKTEGIWNNDWLASQELVLRYWRSHSIEKEINYQELVDFFQSRYRGQGEQPDQWDGYITQEPLLLSKAYLENLTQNQHYWGFFSGATRGSAQYVLQRRLQLESPILVAMEDAPGKPDPQGLIATVTAVEDKYNCPPNTPVIYVGDTVADMYTVKNAQVNHPDRVWIGVGIVPPHLHQHSTTHREKMEEAGASLVLNNVEELNPSSFDL